jgi:hypothetical protein
MSETSYRNLIDDDGAEEHLAILAALLARLPVLHKVEVGGCMATQRITMYGDGTETVESLMYTKLLPMAGHEVWQWRSRSPFGIYVLELLATVSSRTAGNIDILQLPLYSHGTDALIIPSARPTHEAILRVFQAFSNLKELHVYGDLPGTTSSNSGKNEDKALLTAVFTCMATNPLPNLKHITVRYCTITPPLLDMLKAHKFSSSKVKDADNAWPKNKLNPLIALLRTMRDMSKLKTALLEHHMYYHIDDPSKTRHHEPLDLGEPIEQGRIDRWISLLEWQVLNEHGWFNHGHVDEDDGD